MCYFFARLHKERFGGWPETGSGISRESCINPAGCSADIRARHGGGNQEFRTTARN